MKISQEIQGTVYFFDTDTEQLTILGTNEKITCDRNDIVTLQKFFEDIRKRVI